MPPPSLDLSPSVINVFWELLRGIEATVSYPVDTDSQQRRRKSGMDYEGLLSQKRAEESTFRSGWDPIGSPTGEQAVITIEWSSFVK